MATYVQVEVSDTQKDTLLKIGRVLAQLGYPIQNVDEVDELVVLLNDRIMTRLVELDQPGNLTILNQVGMLLA